MTHSPALSIVVPVYNEEECVLSLYQKIRCVCESLGHPYEVIFVDDGSRDRTFEILEEIHRQDPRVKAVRFRKNYGQTAAMAAGFEYAAGICCRPSFWSLRCENQRRRRRMWSEGESGS